MLKYNDTPVIEVFDGAFHVADGRLGGVPGGAFFWVKWLAINGLRRVGGRAGAGGVAMVAVGRAVLGGAGGAVFFRKKPDGGRKTGGGSAGHFGKDHPFRSCLN